MKDEAIKGLSQAERKDVFLALVEAQDGGLPVARSRQRVAKRFGLSEQQILGIEREGIEGKWPPLG